ncbi:AS3MT methyltransferase, partial [Polypterus senegalus]
MTVQRRDQGTPVSCQEETRLGQREWPTGGRRRVELIDRYYGCGMVVPECLEGCRVLDLGCGAGRDCFLLSQLVGEEGHVTGIDMTEEQIAVAQKYVDYHAEKFGFKRPNVNFLQGYIETLQEVGLQECSYDVIISNCVINLSPDKKAVLKEAYRVLKDGGEMYFSDVYVNKRLPKNLRDHKVLLGECLGGALWWLDLIQLAQEVGFCTPRLVSSSLISINNKELESLIAPITMSIEMITIEQRTVTYRVVSMPGDSTYLFHSLCYILHGHIRLTLDIRRNILSYVLNDWDRFKVWTDDGTGDN